MMSIFDNWHWLNFVVIVVYLFTTTYIGKVFSGKQLSLRSFFLGGKKLNWLAVSGSIIATEISAVTFIIVPAISYKHGGNFTYLMLAVGTILARIIIGYYFIPFYFEKEIYSPYQYIGSKLGERVDKMTSVLFMIGAVLGQGVRVFAIAIVLKIVLNVDLKIAIFVIVFFSVIWTLLGGITTVVWTDVVQFAVFVGGAVAALIYMALKIPGGFTEIINEGISNGKFRFINLSTDPLKSFTLWCGIFGTSFLTLASHGTDQMNTQRLLCCKDAKDARKAIIFSSIGVVVTIIMLFTGVALFVYFKHFPLTGNLYEIVRNDPNKVFPVFFVKKLPVVFSGLLVSAVLAAAISSLDSTLAALSQTSVTGFYKKIIKNKSERHYLFISKLYVIFWGILLGGMAVLCDPLSKEYEDIVQFALAMTSFTYGALLGTFFLGFLNTGKDDFGLLWGIPFSMLIVFAMSKHGFYPNMIIFVSLIIAIIFWFIKGRKEKLFLLKSALILLMAFVIFSLNSFYYICNDSGIVESKIYLFALYKDFPVNGSFFKIAWPWYYPIGVLVCFMMGYFIGREKYENG